MPQPTERSGQVTRLVRRGRVATDDGAVAQPQQYALAVVDADGNPVGTDAQVSYLMLAEQQKTNRLLGMLLQQLGGLWVEDGLAGTG